MKRILFVVLCAASLCIGCSKEENTPDIPVTVQGTWQYVQATDTITIINPTKPGQKPGDIEYYSLDYVATDQLALNNDSTFVRAISGQNLTGKWSLSSNKDTLILKDNGTGNAFDYRYSIKHLNQANMTLFAILRYNGLIDEFTVILKR